MVNSKLRDAYYMAGVEYQQLGVRDRMLLGSTVAAIGYDVSPWNEWISGGSGAYVSQNQEQITGSLDFLAKTVETAATAGAAMAVGQMAVGTLTAFSVRKFNQTAGIFNQSEDAISQSNTNNIDLIMLGTAYGVLNEHRHNNNRTIKKDVGFVTKGSLMVGGYMAGLVGTGAVVVNVLKQTGHEDAAALTEKIAINPLSYLAAFALYKGASKLRHKIARHNNYTKLDVVSN